MTELKENDPDYKYYLMSFGKRPPDELYDIEKDPDCVTNLASDPKYATVIKQLKAQMDKALKLQNDPRVLGKGDIFDYYPMAREEKLKKMYKEKYYNMSDKFYEKYGYKTVPMPEGWVEKDGEN
jgi:hypothetical protein